MNWRVGLTALIGGGFYVATTACGDLSIENRPCPCDYGYACCDNTCVPEYDVSIYYNEEIDLSENSPSRCGGPIKSGATDPDTTDTDGRPPRTQLATDQAPKCFAQDTTHLYWMNKDGSVFGVMKAREEYPLRDGGAAKSSQYAVPSQIIAKCGITIDQSAIFATMYGSGSIAMISLDDAKSADEDDRVIGKRAVTFGALLTPSSIAVDSDFVYVTEYDSGLIKRLPKPAPFATTTGDGGVEAGASEADAGVGVGTYLDVQAEVLGQTGAKPHDLIADQESLYWIDSGGVRKMAKQPNSPITTLDPDPGEATVEDAPRDLVLLDGALYWRSNHVIHSVKVSGGAARLIRLHSKEPPVASSKSSSTKTSSDDTDTELSIDAIAIQGGSLFTAARTNVYRVVVDAEMLNGESVHAVEKIFVYRGTNESLATTLLADDVRTYWSTGEDVWMRAR